MTTTFRLLGIFALLLGLAACSKPHDHATGGGHVHRAPHGGMLVEIGQHAYNLEFVRDAAAGKLTAYVLDGHAENFVRIKAASIDLVAFAGGERRALSLRAVANTVTGETVGDTSQFEGQADWLKSVGDFAGTIPTLEIRGSKFDGVALQLKK